MGGGEDAPTVGRWRVILTSGCRDGNEIKRIWEKLQSEARASADWLGEDVPQVLATPVEGIGDVSISGVIRSLIMAARENTRAKALGKALKEMSDPD